MTWFAVPDDLVGGWAVANRQAPLSELDTRFGCDRRWRVDCDCARHPESPDWRQQPDVVICDGCKSQEDARLIVSCRRNTGCGSPTTTCSA